MYIVSFSFSEVSSVKYHCQSLAELEVNVVGDKSDSAIFIFRFPVSRAGKKREFSLQGT